MKPVSKASGLVAVAMFFLTARCGACRVPATTESGKRAVLHASNLGLYYEGHGSKLDTDLVLLRTEHAFECFCQLAMTKVGFSDAENAVRANLIPLEDGTGAIEIKRRRHFRFYGDQWLDRVYVRLTSGRYAGTRGYVLSSIVSPRPATTRPRNARELTDRHTKRRETDASELRDLLAVGRLQTKEKSARTLGAWLIKQLERGDEAERAEAASKVLGKRICVIGGVAPPGGNFDLMAQDVTVRVEMLPRRKALPQAHYWNAIVAGTVKAIDSKRRVVTLVTQSIDGQALDTL